MLLTAIATVSCGDKEHMITVIVYVWLMHILEVILLYCKVANFYTSLQ